MKLFIITTFVNLIASSSLAKGEFEQQEERIKSTSADLTADWTDEKWAKLKAIKKPWVTVDPEYPIPWRPPGNQTGDVTDRLLPDSNDRRWPNSIIPYEIGPEITGSNLEIVRASMAHVELHTCIQFRARQSGDSDYMLIISEPGGCAASGLGYFQGQGVHMIWLDDPGCMYQSVVVHELGHIIGLYHEQNRPDRNDYVRVEWQNLRVEDGWHWQYVKTVLPTTFPRPPRCSSVSIPPYEALDSCYGSVAETFGLAYDYASVMHYSKYAASANGEITMTPIPDADIRLGGQVLSELDAAKIRAAYSCGTETTCGGIITTDSGSGSGILDGTTDTPGSPCEWIVTVPAGKVVILTFDIFDFVDDVGDVTLSDFVGQFTMAEFSQSNPPSSRATFYSVGNKVRVIFNRGSTRNGIKLNWASHTPTCCQHLSLSSNHAQFDSDAKGVYVQKSANSVTGSGKWLIYRKAYAENVYLAHKNTEGGETPWRIANDNVVQPGVEGANLEQLGFDVVCPEHLTRFLHQGSFSTVVDIECLNACHGSPPTVAGSTNDFDSSINFIGAVVTYTCQSGKTLTSTCQNDRAWTAVNDACGPVVCCDVIKVQSSNSAFAANLQGEYRKTSGSTSDGTTTWPIYEHRTDGNLILRHKLGGGATPWHIKDKSNARVVLEHLGGDVACPSLTTRFFADGTYSTEVSVTCVDDEGVDPNDDSCCQYIKVSSSHARFSSIAKGEYQIVEGQMTGPGEAYPVYRKIEDNEVFLARKNSPGGYTPWRLKNRGNPGDVTNNIHILGTDVICPDDLSLFHVPGARYSRNLNIQCIDEPDEGGGGGGDEGSGCCSTIRLTFNSDYAGDYELTEGTYGIEKWPVYKFVDDPTIVLSHRYHVGGATPWHIRLESSKRAIEYLGPDGDCPTNINLYYKSGAFSRDIQVQCLD